MDQDGPRWTKIDPKMIKIVNKKFYNSLKYRKVDLIDYYL